MNAEGILHDANLGDLLEAGDEALALGEARAAHDIWRVAAVANPYDERVWLALLQVLEDEEDRKVCLKNIIAINPLNTEARRQLRLLMRSERKREDAVSNGANGGGHAAATPQAVDLAHDAAGAARGHRHWRVGSRARHRREYRCLRWCDRYGSALILAINADVL